MKKQFLHTIEPCLKIHDLHELDKVLPFLKPYLQIDSVVIEGLKLPTFPEPYKYRDIKIFNRITLQATNNQELKRLVRKHRKNYHLVMVNPITVNQSNFFILDPQVDGIHISPTNKGHEFTKQSARLLWRNQKLLEFDMTPFMTAETPILSLVCRTYRRIFDSVNPSKHLIILSSGCQGVQYLRQERALRALTVVLGLGTAKLTKVHNSSFKQKLLHNVKVLRGEIIDEGVTFTIKQGDNS